MAMPKPGKKEEWGWRRGRGVAKATTDQIGPVDSTLIYTFLQNTHTHHTEHSTDTTHYIQQFRWESGGEILRAAAIVPSSLL